MDFGAGKGLPVNDIPQLVFDRGHPSKNEILFLWNLCDGAETTYACGLSDFGGRVRRSMGADRIAPHIGSGWLVSNTLKVEQLPVSTHVAVMCAKLGYES